MRLLRFKKPEKGKALEGRQAFEQAKSNLEEAMRDREAVMSISTFLKGERIENHLSTRIAKMLREGR